MIDKMQPYSYCLHCNGKFQVLIQIPDPIDESSQITISDHEQLTLFTEEHSANCNVQSPYLTDKHAIYFGEANSPD